KENEIAGENEEHRDYHQRDRPLRHLPTRRRPEEWIAANARQTHENGIDQKNNEELYRVIDRDRKKSVAYRRKRERQRNPFGGFDYQSFFGFDKGVRHGGIFPRNIMSIIAPDCKTLFFACQRQRSFLYLNLSF